MAITVTEEFLPDAGVVEGQDWKRSSDLSLLALYNVTAVLFLGQRLPAALREQREVSAQD